VSCHSEEERCEMFGDVLLFYDAGDRERERERESHAMMQDKKFIVVKDAIVFFSFLHDFIGRTF
jgi:hypothetical protein